MRIHTANRHRRKALLRAQAARREPVQPGLRDACQLITDFADALQTTLRAFNAAIVPWADMLKAEMDAALAEMKPAIEAWDEANADACRESGLVEIDLPRS
jgi:hypothetical protein